MKKITDSNSFAWKPWLIGFLLFASLFLCWFYFVVGIAVKHFLFLGAIFTCLFLIPRLRNPLLALSPFLIFLIFYESLKIFPPLQLFEIHNVDLYELERQLFGVQWHGNRVTLSDYFFTNYNSIFDFITGVGYLTWVPFPVGYAIFLIVKNRSKLAFRFLMGFLITSLLGFVLYVSFPAAPPWYYLNYGPEVLLNTPGSAAGLLRFDELIGVSVYEGIYSQNGYIFGAIPSLHCAYPTVLTFYSLKYPNKVLSIIFLISALVIWFTAVYSLHHYVIDVLLGILCAVIGIGINEGIYKYRFKKIKVEV